MDITQLLKETEKRYQGRKKQRQVNLDNLSSGSVLQANSPERIERRMRRLSQRKMPVSPAPGDDSFAIIATELGGEVNSLERVLGKNDLIGIAYLELGMLVSRTVGRIVIRDSAGRTIGYGTGFLVSSRLLMTNNHVLSSASDAATSQVEFDFQQHLTGPTISSQLFGLEPKTFFLTDPHLDYTLVAVSEQGLDGSSPRSFGWNQLIEEEGKAIIGECLNIIQHPNGEPKQLALRENKLIDVLDDFLHYQTDTAPGSSGSPVFNDQWEVVALHHSGVPRRDEQGNLLTKDKAIWRPEMGEHRIDWVANEGARISRVLRHLKDQSMNTAQRRLRAEIFETAPPAPQPETRPSGPTAARAAAGPEPPTSPDNLVTWTIPLQISIRLGDAAAAGQTASISIGAGKPPAGRSPSATRTAPNLTPAAGQSSELDAALAELAEAATRPYFDEAKNREEIKAYYQSLPSPQRSGKAGFYQKLSELVTKTHTTLINYKPANFVYPWVDLQPDLKLRSIYSGITFNPEQIIREDFRIAQERAVRLSEILRVESEISPDRLAEEVNLLEAALPYNCEHSVPQSWFDKREPMRGDLHHLFTCESGCNSFRGNTPYFDFADFMEVVRNDCGKREENKFEPTAGKGTVARAVFYFLLRYPGLINSTATEYTPDRIKILLDWHKRFPVTLYEQHRNQAIFAKQGNRNPLIDHPEWTDKIDFLKGLG